METHCAICFDDGTPKRPLIKPCNTCSIETHKECILNLISTHLISERNELADYLKPSYILDNGLLQQPEGIEIFDKTEDSILYATSLDFGKSHYLKYFTRGSIINRYPPKFSTHDTKDVIYMRGLTHKMIYVNDKCPQCKNNIKLISPIKTWMPSFLYSKNNIFFPFQIFLTTLKTKNFIIKNIIYEKPIYYIETFCSIISSVCGALPWAYLGRNILEFKPIPESRNIFEDFSIFDSLCLSSELSSVTQIWLLIRLIMLGNERNNSLPSYLKFLAFLIKQISDIIYIFTFNWIYLNWALEVKMDKLLSKSIFDKTTPYNYESLKNITLIEKIYLLNCYDCKEFFIGVWKDSDFTNEDDNFMNSSFDNSFKFIFLSFFGFSFGNKIIGKCKPIIKFIYRIFKNFNPLPVEIEMIIEYLGYQVILFGNTLFDFYSVYCEYMSIKSFKLYID